MKRIRPFDSRQLQAFDMLCSTGSFTVTAKRLFLTQSAVSHSMKSLEEECGSRLFRRQGKKVSLTEAGDRLLRFTRPFLVEMEKVREELDGFEKFGVGRIRLGASAQACRFLLPPMLSQFKKEHPLCRFEVKCEDTPQCLELLGLGEIDLAITLEPIRINEIEFAPCFSDELRVVVPSDHRWAEAGKVNWSEAGEESFILYNRGSYTFRIINDYLNRAGVSSRVLWKSATPKRARN